MSAGRRAPINRAFHGWLAVRAFVHDPFDRASLFVEVNGELVFVFYFGGSFV